MLDQKSLNYKFTFGKYRNKTIKETNDKEYLIWCLKNIRDFMIDKETILWLIDEKELNTSNSEEFDYGDLEF